MSASRSLALCLDAVNSSIRVVCHRWRKQSPATNPATRRKAAVPIDAAWVRDKRRERFDGWASDLDPDRYGITNRG